MPLRGEIVAIAAAVLLAVPAASAQPTPGRPAAAAPTDAEIARAIEAVRADPNLTPERTVKTLRWRDPGARRAERTPAWLAWITGFFRWVAQSTRVMIWAAAVVLAAMLVIYISRMMRERSGRERDGTFVAPTHVRDLDIRPESLPRDLGGAARALWDRGEHRAALALLYRGLLSRLAHVHQVPIRDSSTEGDCLALAERHLTSSRWQYAARLVSVWQRFVYAGQDIQAATVHVLCDDFAGHLDASAPSGAQAGGQP